MKHLLMPAACLALSACGQPAPDNSAASGEAGQTPTTTSAQTETPEQTAVTEQAADPLAEGKRLFARCAACHSVESGKNGIGPSLHGIVGKSSATAAGFTYSAAMQDAKLTWDDATLSAYLENPQAYVKGNKMAFAGLKKPEDREALIAYLETLK